MWCVGSAAESLSEVQGLCIIKISPQTSRYEQLPGLCYLLCDHGYAFSFRNVVCIVIVFCTLTGLGALWDHSSWSDSIELCISQWTSFWPWSWPATLTLTNHLKLHNDQTKRGQSQYREDISTLMMKHASQSMIHQWQSFSNFHKMHEILHILWCASHPGVGERPRYVIINGRLILIVALLIMMCMRSK